MIILVSTVLTAHDNIDAHISIISSISLLVFILGAGPEIFMNLGIHIWTKTKYLCLTWVLSVALVASQYLSQAVPDDKCNYQPLKSSILLQIKWLSYHRKFSWYEPTHPTWVSPKVGNFFLRPSSGPKPGLLAPHSLEPWQELGRVNFNFNLTLTKICQ